MIKNYEKLEATVKFTISFTLSLLIFILFIYTTSSAITHIVYIVTGTYVVSNFILMKAALLICVSSAASYYLYLYYRKLKVTISTYRFYKTLCGRASLSLLAESYHTVIKTFEVPILAYYTDENDVVIRGQWNAVGDWAVLGVKETKGFTGNAKWKKDQLVRQNK